MFDPKRLPIVPATTRSPKLTALFEPQSPLGRPSNEALLHRKRMNRNRIGG